MNRHTPLDMQQAAEAEGWRPEAGDVLVGTVEDVDVGWSDFRGDYPIITITAGEGTKSANVQTGQSVKVHCFHDVLFARVMTLRPVTGETVGIQFHGKQQHRTKPQQSVSRYTFKVAGRGADVAALYDRMGGSRRPQQQQQQRTPAPVTGGDFEQQQMPADTANTDDIPF